MVVLTKLATDFYKSLGFKNRTTGINFAKYVLQVTANKYKTEDDFKQFLKPKISKLSSLGIDINDKKNSTTFKVLKDIKKIESKKGKKQNEEIEEKIKKLEKAINTGVWHISGTIKIKEKYNKVSKSGREYIYYKEERDGIIHKGTRAEAIDVFSRSMARKYERIDPSPDIEYTIEDVNIGSITQVNESGISREDMPMKNSTQLDYNIIDEYKDFLENKGTCVIDNFIGMYGQELKITREKFIDMCQEYYNQYKFNWTVENGISPRCVNSICEIYFAVNNHMYLIVEDAVRKSLIEKTKVKESFNTSLLENEEERENNNIYDNYNIIVNVNLDSIFRECKDTIYMFSREGKTNINDIFIHMLTNFGVPQNIRCKKTKIVGFSYKCKLGVINYVFTCDPNDVNQISFKEIKILCEKNSIPFKNQTFTQFITQIRVKYFDELKGRIKFSKEFKQLVLNKSNGKCACCNCKLENKYHTDHIIPLANNGTNELSNLQALCVGCHMDKTHNEQENGQFVKFSETESTFNNQVQEIMSSNLSSSFAFVERLHKTHMEETIFTIDINKCRRNILLNHKYDYCVFNVMDDVEEFNTNSKITEGLYYIETDVYDPFRGNGWYYHSLTSFGLDNSLISRDNIKKVIYASSTLKHNYYNGFIEYCNKNVLSYEEIQEHYNKKEEEYKDDDGETIDRDFLCLVKDKYITDYKKAGINSMIGAFKPNLNKHSKWSSTIVTKCKLEALNHAIEKDESFIDTFSYDDQEFYHVISPNKVSNVETERPLYDQIVQQEAIELYKLKTLIESKGGKVTDLNTDAITCTFPDNKLPFDLSDGKNIDGYYWDDEKTILKYKLEPVGKHVLYPKMEKHIRTDKYEHKTTEFNVTPDVEGNDFTPLINKIIDSNSSCLITGPPGAGKTTLLNMVKEYLTDNNKIYKCLAPTNLAALLINGTTIHKFSCKLKKFKAFMEMKLDYIFVDEVSMLHSNFYKILMIIKKLKNCKLIISGDFNQLDVIHDLQKYDYKDTSILKELCDNNLIQLSKCRRSDDTLFNLIQFDNIPNLKKSDFDNKDTEINICWTNETRKTINYKYMQIAAKRDRTKNYFILQPLPYDENSQEVKLVRKTPIIAKINNSKLKLINNERYIISKINIADKEITVKNDRNEVTINSSEFQKLFRVGYAFTTHSCQGMTINEPYTIHDFDRMHKKLKYVALSRATKKENINII